MGDALDPRPLPRGKSRRTLGQQRIRSGLRALVEIQVSRTVDKTHGQTRGRIPATGNSLFPECSRSERAGQALYNLRTTRSKRAPSRLRASANRNILPREIPALKLRHRSTTTPVCSHLQFFDATAPATSPRLQRCAGFHRVSAS